MISRDNLLFVTIGALAGFISGYFVHEVMAVRQPPPLAVLQAAQAAQGGAMAGAGAAAGAPGGAAGGPGVPAAAGGPAGAMDGGPMVEIQALKARIDANPEDAEAILRLANLNYDINRWDRARELYTRYLELRPAHPDVLTDLGVAYRGLGQYDEALRRFDEAQRLQSNHWQSLFNQVVVLAFDLRDLRRADEALRRLQALQPQNPDVARLAREVAQVRDGGAA